VSHALDLVPRVVLLMRLAFLESESRGDVLERRGLRAVHVFRFSVGAADGASRSLGREEGQFRNRVLLDVLGSGPQTTHTNRSDQLGALAPVLGKEVIMPVSTDITTVTFVEILDACIDYRGPEHLESGVEHMLPFFLDVLRADEEWLRKVVREHLTSYARSQAFMRERYGVGPRRRHQANMNAERKRGDE
jgi:hypothetical protein